MLLPTARHPATPRSPRHYPLTIVGVTVLALAAAWAVDRLQPSRYQAGALLAIAPESTEPGFVLEPQVVAAARFLDGLSAALPPPPAPDGEIEAVARSLFQPLYDRLAEERLTAAVRADGRNLQITATAPSAARAEALVELAARQLLAERLARQGAARDDRLAAVQAARDEAQALLTGRLERLARAEAADLAARRERTARLAEEHDAAAARLDALAQELARLQLAAVEPFDLDWLLTRPRAGTLAEALAARAAAVERLQAVDRVYGDRHPLHAAARDEVAARTAMVREEVANLVAAAMAAFELEADAVAALEVALAEARAELAAGEAAEAERASLERAVAQDRARLADLDATAERLAGERLALLADARLVARTDAVAQAPPLPWLGLYAGAAVAGLVAGFGLAGWRAGRRPQRYRTRAVLAEDTGFTVLGALPPLPRRLDRLAKSRAADAVERLWLQCEAAPVPVRSLAVTAPDRTVDVARLAAALAQAARAQGCSVLLIDGGGPGTPLHRLLGVKAGEGLGEVATGAAAWTDVVVPLGERGPWLLARGSTPKGEAVPAQIEVLLQSAERRFDRIIVAAPPLTTTQGLKLVRACRASLIAVRADVTRRRPLETALAEARAVGAELLGLVLVDASRRA